MLHAVCSSAVVSHVATVSLTATSTPATSSTACLAFHTSSTTWRRNMSQFRFCIPLSLYRNIKRAFNTSLLSKTLQFHVSLTWCGSIDLSHVTRRRYGGHDKVERDGKVHGRHRIGACSNHTNLVVGLEIHIGWTSCCWKKDRLISDSFLTVWQCAELVLSHNSANSSCFCNWNT